jgi:EpsD family peptidyl-prolyl cis-trans isomerase
MHLAIKPFVRATAVICLLGLAGCNNAKTPAKPTPEQNSQIIAKVGKEDVTIHELQNEYRLAGITPDKVNDNLTRAVLAEIVKRKGLAQRAQAAGLDREPTVLLDLMRGREQILATALLQRDVQAKTSSIGKAEIDRYVNANPERFSKRTRFDVDQLQIPVSSLNQKFLDTVKDATSLDTVEAKAAEANIPYSRGNASLFSGDLPADLLSRLRNRKDTDVFFAGAPQTGTFFKVRTESPDPLSGEAATRRGQILLRQETARTEIANKDAGAEVTYLGSYTKLMEKPQDAARDTAPATTDAPAAPPQK